MMTIEPKPGSKRLRIHEDGRLRMDDFRQLQEDHAGIAWRIAKGLGEMLSELYSLIIERRILARYVGGKLVLEVDR